jgi:hypothetical protein
MRQIFFLCLAVLKLSSAICQPADPDCPEKLKQVKAGNSYSTLFKTKLKEGYKLHYSFDCENQYLLLLNGKKIVDTLSGTDVDNPYPLLGYVYADFNRYFVFAMRNGTNAPLIEVREKATGKNLVPAVATLIDVSENSSLIFFYESDIPEYGDSFVMLDLRTLKRKMFPFPKDIFGEPGVCKRLKLKNVTATKLVFSYLSDGANKTQTYSR